MRHDAHHGSRARSPARACAALACVLLALACGCGGHRATDTVIVRIHGSADRPLSPDQIRYVPKDNVISARIGTQGTLAIERRDASRALQVQMPEMCPVTLPAGAQRQPVDAKPMIDLGPDRAPVGFDAPFAISVRHGCDQLGRGRIDWRQTEGAPVSDLAIAQDGFELRARTPRFETLHPQASAPGILAFSPHTQGRVVFEALWHGPGSAPIRRTIAIVATSRATGLSSVSVSQQLLLAGAGWHVQQAPQFGHARVHELGSLSEFTPDAQGHWQLERDGHTLVVQATWHDKTPYDCGRSECHAGIAETTQESPMSAALTRQLDVPQPSAVGCMLDCHVLGERGLRDGGFLDVSAQLGFTWLASTRWQDLPQALRRLGGVRCTACHGPGVLPAPEGRELILRSDVCATCHDAPPRYMHVAQWRASRMARADAAPATRSSACAMCHTTAGFLARVASRQPRPQLLEAEPTGIACAACHAPHDDHRGARLLRGMPGSSESTSDPRSAACVQCHSPLAGEARPSASSSALWEGHVRVPAATGNDWDEISAPAAHAGVRGGCIGCHGATDDGRVDHSFRADARTCQPCHASGMDLLASSTRQSLRERAAALANRLERACEVTAITGAQPPHAMADRAGCKAPGLARAQYEVDLVREDPAAFVHNAALARRLLDDAERLTPSVEQNGRARTPPL